MYRKMVRIFVSVQKQFKTDLQNWELIAPGNYVITFTTHCDSCKFSLLTYDAPKIEHIMMRY